MTYPDLRSGCHNPLSAIRGRLSTEPGSEQFNINFRGSPANTSMLPADHRSPVYSLTAAAPHRTGSGGPNGWRAAACASNCKVATKFCRQGALSIGCCIWSLYTCSESPVNPLIFEGQEKSSRAVFCQDIAAAVCRTLRSHAKSQGSAHLAQHDWLLSSNTFLRTQSVLRGRKRCRRRGRQRWL